MTAAQSRVQLQHPFIINWTSIWGTGLPNDNSACASRHYISRCRSNARPKSPRSNPTISRRELYL